MTKTVLGNYIQEYLDANRISQRELARRAGISNATISRLIAGLPPSEYTLSVLADVMEVPAASLFHLAGYIDDEEYKGAAIAEALHLMNLMPEEEQWNTLDFIRIKYRHYNYYRCRGNMEGRCSQPRIKAEYVEGLVIGHLRETMLTPSVLRKYLDRIEDAAFHENEAAKQELQALIIEETWNNRKVEGVIDAIAEMGYSGLLGDKLKVLEQRAAEIAQRKVVLDTDISTYKTTVVSEEEIRELVDRLAERIATGDTYNARRLLAYFIDRIEINSEKIIIHYTLSRPKQDNKAVPPRRDTALSFQRVISRLSAYRDRYANQPRR